MNLFYQPFIQDGIHQLESEEARHCLKVLRKQKGDLLAITDGKGCFYEARITEVARDKCSFEVLNKREEPRRNYKIHLAISPTKNMDRIEWLMEKVVELGIDEISFIVCKTSERKNVKPDRVERIALSAMKQSLRASLPVIHPLSTISQFLSQTQSDEKFIAYVDATNPDHLAKVATKARSYCILIGPEGDFTQEELGIATHQGYQKVSLGNHRLRTETAGIAACHILNLINL